MKLKNKTTKEKKLKQTRNAWQSLVYSPLGAVVSVSERQYEKMNEYRPISAESQHNFHFLPHFTQKLLNRFSPFLHDVEQLVELLMRASARR